MNEDLLQYIWKTQSFDHQNLCTTDGVYTHIFDAGIHNHDSGPDFAESRIKIGEYTWVGHVEIHYKSSEWYAHRHHTDRKYDNVILHVVWIDDKSVHLETGEKIPTLELKNRVDPNLLVKSKKLLNSQTDIRCSKSINEVNTFKKLAFQSKLVIERLESKSEKTLRTFRLLDKNWENTSYQLLAEAFGLKVNRESFGLLANNTPLNYIKRMSNLHQVLALLFGQSGLIITEDKYGKNLESEYRYLKHKFQLSSSQERFHWKFSRLRPNSFPTVRIARLGAFLHNEPNLFDSLIHLKTGKELLIKLNTKTDPYWSNHYDFGKKSTRDHTQIGRGFLTTILLNVCIPLLAAYSREVDDQVYMDQAISLLESLPFENNKVTRKYDLLGFPKESASDSQAQIQLYHEYCLKKKCLSCNIGTELIG